MSCFTVLCVMADDSKKVIRFVILAATLKVYKLQILRINENEMQGHMKPF